MSKPTGPWRIFRIPLLLGVVSLVGLISALLFEGPIDLLWVAAIAVPLVAIVVSLARRA